jgi:hypothetical protein
LTTDLFIRFYDLIFKVVSAENKPLSSIKERQEARRFFKEKDIEIVYGDDNTPSEESTEELIYIAMDNAPLYILSALYPFHGEEQTFTDSDVERIKGFLLEKGIDCYISCKTASPAPQPETISPETQIKNAIEKISNASEKITRRNMKIQVSEFIQVRCDSDPDFAALILNPKKNLVNCFKYINRMAMEWIKEDAKARGEELHGQIGGDVPDDIIFDWSIEYFQKTGLPEDEEKAKPVSPSPTQKSKDKKVDSKEEISKKANGKPATSPNNQKNKEPDLLDTGQLSLFG